MANLNLYLFIFINDVCRYAFVYHFGENGWSWGAVLPGSLLCQPHLVTLGAQWSLWVTVGRHGSHRWKGQVPAANPAARWDAAKRTCGWLVGLCLFPIDTCPAGLLRQVAEWPVSANKHTLLNVTRRRRLVLG